MKNVFKFMKNQKSFNFIKLSNYTTLETLQTRVDKTSPTFTVKRFNLGKLSI